MNSSRSIIHMDMDTFFVSVERLIEPRLLHKPVIIGGSNRGVVASCSYETRKFGVHSAMPMKLALQLCPDATVISGDMEAYSRYSHQVTEIITEVAPVFKKSSIDEFYLDVSGMDKYFGCFQWGKELRSKIIKETGLPLSMGLSVNKLISKIATGEAKPNNSRHIEPGTETAFLDPMPIRKIPMIGQKTAQFLMQMGIHKVETLRNMPRQLLEQTFGKNGSLLWQRANGIDHSPITPYSEQKSISTESTFHHDTMDVKQMKIILTAMVEKLAYKLRSQNRLTCNISIKIRYSNFDTENKQKKIPYTANDETLIRYAKELFQQLYTRRMMIRMIGVRLSGLVHGNYQINLFDDTQEHIQLFQAMDTIRNKHGIESIVRANTLGLDKRLRENRNFFTGDLG
ncbi:DNA polymerase IV [Marivirga lumbricoides]|uniref:DNA polymerase IV n=1 Tax=Marivirga lumbricoides TaxID=1046115 RepID=A0A2T4DR33_9BACT|nr:DNA polymerase IV [Marivirga lumbricoides]